LGLNKFNAKAQGIECDGRLGIEKNLTPNNYHDNGKKPNCT
jgi:hypothetical protein